MTDSMLAAMKASEAQDWSRAEFSGKRRSMRAAVERLPLRIATWCARAATGVTIARLRKSPVKAYDGIRSMPV